MHRSRCLLTPLLVVRPRTQRLRVSVVRHHSNVSTPDYGSWLAQSSTVDTVQPPSMAVQAFLGVADLNLATLSFVDRKEIVASNEFVTKIGAVATWCFKTHGELFEQAEDTANEDFEQIDGTMKALSPWGNMAKGDLWQHFYIRQFFLTQAPLESFMALYEVHRRALAATKEKPLPLPSGLLVREFCWRGRFHEAVEAYIQLPLSDRERRSFTALLFEYEQFAILRYVYKIQAEIDHDQGRARPLLDPLFIMHAMRELHMREEMIEYFDTLARDDQRRPEIQRLLDDGGAQHHQQSSSSRRF